MRVSFITTAIVIMAFSLACGGGDPLPTQRKGEPARAVTAPMANAKVPAPRAEASCESMCTHFTRCKAKNAGIPAGSLSENGQSDSSKAYRTMKLNCIYGCRKLTQKSIQCRQDRSCIDWRRAVEEECPADMGKPKPKLDDETSPIATPMPKFLRIEPSTFLMGTPEKTCRMITNKCPTDDPFTAEDESQGCKSEEEICTGRAPDRRDSPAHQVTLTRPFLLAHTEVTQRQWHTVMGTNPAKYKSEALGYRSADNPVEEVSWFDAIAFVNALSEKEELPPCYSEQGEVIGGATIYDCTGYRLPTEAEWEYAVRANTIGPTYAPLEDIAYIAQKDRWGGLPNDIYHTKPVGLKTPNSFGLYDMLGNVGEWCHDVYNKYEAKSLEDPSGPKPIKRDDGRVVRAVRDYEHPDDIDYLHAANREGWSPTLTTEIIGFRPARTAP